MWAEQSAEDRQSCMLTSSKTTDGNRELVTILESVSALGVAVPPMIIFKGKALYIGWMKDVEKHQAAYFAHSDSGYTNDELTFEWLVKVFDPHTRTLQPARTTKPRRRLLILDNHHSHITYRFAKFCHDNDILLLNLPPHTTHALQPLDVGVFGALGTCYRQEIQKVYTASMGQISISKNNFYSILTSARGRAYTPLTLRNSFRSCGIWPLNSAKVYRKFNLTPRALTPELSTPHFATVPTTPKTPRTLRRLTRDVVADPDNTNAITAIQQLSHAAENAMAERDILQTQITRLREALRMQGKPDRRQLQTTALLLSSEEVVEAIKVREEEQAAKKKRKKKPVAASDSEGEEGEDEQKPMRQQRKGVRRRSLSSTKTPQAKRVAWGKGEARRQEILPDSDSDNFESASDTDSSIESVIKVARKR